MANTRSPDWYLGRRFSVRFTVISIGEVPFGGTEDDRIVKLHMDGDKSEISFGELRTLVETGFVGEEAT